MNRRSFLGAIGAALAGAVVSGADVAQAVQQAATGHTLPVAGEFYFAGDIFTMQILARGATTISAPDGWPLLSIPTGVRAVADFKFDGKNWSLNAYHQRESRNDGRRSTEDSKAIA